MGQSFAWREEAGLAFSTAALSMHILASRFLGATEALEEDLHPLICQQAIIVYPSLVPPPALAANLH